MKGYLACLFLVILFPVHNVIASSLDLAYNGYGLSIGLLNFTKRLHGVQIGLINYARNNPKVFRVLPVINVHL